MICSAGRQLLSSKSLLSIRCAGFLRAWKSHGIYYDLPYSIADQKHSSAILLLAKHDQEKVFCVSTTIQWLSFSREVSIKYADLAPTSCGLPCWKLGIGLFFGSARGPVSAETLRTAGAGCRMCGWVRTSFICRGKEVSFLLLVRLGDVVRRGGGG